MFESQYQDQPTLRLQHAIHEFKQKQHDRFTLEKKLHILKQKYQMNKKKAKVIKTQVSKINHIKQEYQNSRSQIQSILANEAQKNAKKIKRDKTLREQSKQNMHVIRNLVQRQKYQDYAKVKQKTQVNKMTITQNFRQTLHLKRQKSLQIKIQEENSRLNRTIYLEKKRLLAQSQSETDLVPIEVGTARNAQYIKHMRDLQKEMVEQLIKSRNSLSNSKLSFQKSLR